MNLYLVEEVCYGDISTKLKVGANKEEVGKEILKSIPKTWRDCTTIFIKEIKEVDGYPILLGTSGE